MGKSNSIGSADSRSVLMLWRGIASSTLFRTDQVVQHSAEISPRGQASPLRENIAEQKKPEGRDGCGAMHHLGRVGKTK